MSRVLNSTLSIALVTIAALGWSRGSADANPYSGIVERNTFGLKPPVNPADLVKAPPPVVADIKLQGITTILGRKQVLMKIKVPARAPEPAREQSFVFVEGQREGEVEVKEINPVDGIVKLDNAGTPLVLNMQEHGEKPTPGAAPAAPPAGAAPPSPVPNLPPPATPSSASMNPANPGMTVSAFGGTGESRANPALPARSVRTGTPGTAGAGTTGLSFGGQSTPQSSYQPPSSGLSVDEQMAVLAVQKAAGSKGSPTSALLPPLPAKYQQPQ
jgi:hypothetical protein